MKRIVRFELGFGGNMLMNPDGDWVKYEAVKAVLSENLYKMEQLHCHIEDLLALVEACTPEAEPPEQTNAD